MANFVCPLGKVAEFGVFVRLRGSGEKRGEARDIDIDR